jgi:hypothetical protein
MDLTSLVTPGAQSLVTAILTESWGQLRTAVARKWARRHRVADGSVEAAPDTAAIDAAGRELDSARDLALALAGEGSAAERGARMQLFLAGYLAGQLAARPELADAVGLLPTLLAAALAPALAPAETTLDASVTYNSMSGTSSGIVIQAGRIGGIGGLGGGNERG